MSKITIYNTSLDVKEYQGQRVITLKDVDAVHQRPEGTARRNFNDNKERFIENVDYFFVKPADVQTYDFRTSEINNSGTYLLTESGYLMLVKSFTDNLAWDVQRDLVNHYFKFREQAVSPAIVEPIPYPKASMGEVANFIQSMRLLMKEERIPPNKIALTIAKMGRAWNVEFPPEFIGNYTWAFALDSQMQIDTL